MLSITINKGFCSVSDGKIIVLCLNMLIAAGINKLSDKYFSFDIYRDCVTDKFLNLDKKIGFVILNNCWENVKHIKEIVDECKLVKCYILFASFSNENWAKKIAKEIVNILKNGSKTSL